MEGFTCLLVFKNIFSFALTFKGFEWIQQGQVQPVFTAVASVQVGICLLTVPMCESTPFFLLILSYRNKLQLCTTQYHRMLCSMRLCCARLYYYERLVKT